MTSIRNGAAATHLKAGDYPVERFVTDFGRLITDVDRLMTDLSSITTREVGLSRTNGVHQEQSLNDTISTLRQHARSFVKSAVRSGAFHDRLPVPYMELDSKARIRRTNKECAAILDPAGHSVLGKSVFTFVVESDARRLREYLAACRENDRPSPVPVSIVRKGERLPVELCVRRQPEGSPMGYTAVLLESASGARKAAVAGETPKDPETLIHEFVVELSSATTFTSVAQLVRGYCSRAFTSPAGMIFVERDGKVRLVSQWQSSHVSKKHFSEERVRKGAVTHAFRTGTPVFWSQTKSSQPVARYLRSLLPGPRHRTVAFLPISKPGERPAGVLAIVAVHEGELPRETREDMCRFAQMVSGSMVRAITYDEAIAARAEAERANKQQADFLSVISHELRNPMTPILNWAIALSSGRLPAAKQNFAIEAIVRNVRALNYLIDDLFDAARISSGKLRLDLAEMRIQETAREALAAAQQAAESKKLRITTDISEAVPPFFADPRRVRQVLINLLNNAVKFTSAGGSITMRVGMRRGQVECAVSDTGKGIAPEFLPFVFDRFQQEDRSSKNKGAGLGLGLAIVREIVELHGGNIKAHSHGTDHGSTFIFHLPLRRHKGSTVDRNLNTSRQHLQPKNAA